METVNFVSCTQNSLIEFNHKIGSVFTINNERTVLAVTPVSEKEIIFQADLETLIGKRPFDAPTTYTAFVTQNGEEEKEEAEQPEAETPESSSAPASPSASNGTETDSPVDENKDPSDEIKPSEPREIQ